MIEMMHNPIDLLDIIRQIMSEGHESRVPSHWIRHYIDPTVGGMYYVDGDLHRPSGQKLRGQTEARVIARMEADGRLQ